MDDERPPLDWKRGRNPYLHNAFGILGVGPGTPVNVVQAKARNLEQRARVPPPPELGGVPLTEELVAEACKALSVDKARAIELMLAHPQVRLDQTRRQEIVRRIQEKATLPDGRAPLPLVHPLAILWFMPNPGTEAAQWPPLEEFHFVGPGQPDDLDLDVVFDV